MRQFLLLFLILLLSACAQNDAKPTDSATTTKPDNKVTQQKRLALIMGNSAYADNALKTPVNDATDLAAKFQILGFELLNNKSLLNANKQQIQQAVQDFATQLKQGDIGLLFYAGHGMQINQANYLLPLGAGIKNKADVAKNAVSLKWVLAELAKAKNSINFIIVDASRDSSWQKLSNAKQGLVASQATAGGLIAFSASPNKVAVVGVKQRNSVYTKALLSALDKSGIDVLRLFAVVRQEVKKATKNQQIPWENHALIKDAYFNGGPKDRVVEQQKELRQLRVIRKQQQAAERKLQQALKRQQQAQGNVQKQQANSALMQARSAAERVRKQGQSLGITIKPSAMEGVAVKHIGTQVQVAKVKNKVTAKQENGKNDFDKAFLVQQQAFLVAQEQKADSADYTQAKTEHSSVAYWHYLKKCSSPCAHSESAATAYMQLQTKQDIAAYQSADNENTPKAFRYYLDNCNIVCAQRQVAEKSLKTSEQAARAVQQDSQYYAQARKYGSVPALAAYLSSCKECQDIAQFDQHWDKQQLADLPADASRRIAQFNKPAAVVVASKSSKKPATKQAKVTAPEVKKQVAAEKPKEKTKQAVITEELKEKERLAGKMIMLKPGCFQMGNSNGSRDEKPVHKVCLTQSYELGQYEVTQAQWQAVMGKNPAHFNGSDRPVEEVSWHDVQNFLAKLNQKTGLKYRLPTEAEWEFACRAGQRKEYCGDDINSIAWYEGNSNAKTHAVGLKQANALGFYDMSGNVWEWVEDRYDERYYHSSPSNDPKGAVGAASRVYRGGSWYNGASYSRATNRDYDSPSNRDRNLGFRLARTL